MVITNDYSKIKKNGLAITIGKFDGVHLGHKKLLNTLLAEKGDLSSCVFTFVFDGSYNRIIKPICTKEEKESILDQLGIDYCIEYPFDEKIASLTPEEFVENVLVKKLCCKLLVVGDDFRFGRKRAGDTDLLRTLSEKHGFRLIVIKREEYEGIPISSTRIRNEILEHHSDKAKAMLGR